MRRRPINNLERCWTIWPFLKSMSGIFKPKSYYAAMMLKVNLPSPPHTTWHIDSTLGNEASFTRMNERFAVMDQDISHLLAQWEESKASLSDLVGSEPKKCASRSSLPSPPSSPGSTIRKRTSLRRSYALSTAPTSLSMASHMIDSPSGPPLPSLKGLQSQAPPSPEVSRLSIVQPRDRNSATPWTHSSGDLPKPSSTEPFCS